MKLRPHRPDRPDVDRRPATPLGFPAAGVGNAGFTLIELLVVIVIVAVLAGLSLPVLSRVQAASRTVKCSSNLRQIGVGMLSYAGDNNMMLPPGPTWDKAISSYLNITSNTTAASVFTCPEDNRQKTMGSGQFARSYTTNGVNQEDESYGMFSDTVMPASRRLNMIRSATTIIVLEYWTNSTGVTVDNEQFKTPFAWTTPYLDVSVAPRLANGTFYHGTRENYLFADGHVETLDPAIPCKKGNVLWQAVSQ